MNAWRTLLALTLSTGLAANAAHAQFPLGDWGDAPEGWTAYWDNGNGGNFPTCFGWPYAWHAPPPMGIAQNCYFGMDVDPELDGNGGNCFVPYELDECYPFHDGDAGLFMPTAYTYGPSNQVITCSGLPPTSIGPACEMARWGRDIEISVTNNIAPNIPAYLNVLVDWDRSGDWSPFPSGPTGCGVQIAEHVVRNLLIPAGFSGLLSSRGLADFQIGPDTGLVWVRFQISEQQVLFPYFGQGAFEFGETEDYLLHISAPDVSHELGDAPQGVRAYPNGTIGQFPTCSSSPNWLNHGFASQIFFGPGIDEESEGNQNNCAFTPYDNDECYQDGDAGLIVPRPFTIDAATSGIEPCSVSGTPLAMACTPIVWGADLDMQITNNSSGPAFLNMLVDWDHSGHWQNTPAFCPGGTPLDEHVLVNLAIAPGVTTLLSTLAPPPVIAGGPGYAWVRFTISDIPAPLGYDGGGHMGLGETEDYLMLVAGEATGVAGEGGARPAVGGAWPNPARGPVRLDYVLPSAAPVAAAIYDLNGRRIRDLGATVRDAGSQRLEWDGRNQHGANAASGVYFIHLKVGAETHVRQVLLLH